MFFAHDLDKNFYYRGLVEPYPGIFRDYLTTPTQIAVDVESISLKNRTAVGIGFSPNPAMSFYFPLYPTQSPVIPWHLLDNPNITKIFHNSLFDLSCLWNYPTAITNIKDTAIMAHLLGIPGGLSDLYELHQSEVHDMGLLLGRGQTTLDLPTETIARKCMEDTIATYILYLKLLDNTDQQYFDVEMKLIPILDKMSRRGIKLDQKVRHQLEVKLKEEIEIYLDICDKEGFNPNSPQQVSYILAKRGAYSGFSKLPFTRKGNRGNLSTAKEILGRMDDPLAAMVTVYKGQATLLGNYILPWEGCDRAYTRFHEEAITGRISSLSRNLNNIPKGEPRNIFLPDNGIWTDMDFNQLELRILAYLSQDREMMYIFSLPKLNPDGSPNIEADIHQQVADALGIGRYIAKNINYEMVYGSSEQTMADTAKTRDIGKASKMKQMWFQKFPQAGDCIESWKMEALDTPYIITLFGRRIKLPTPDEDSIDAIMRKGVNYRMQGSAAEILKRSIICLADLDLALQVHDEILIDGFVVDDVFRQLEHISPVYTPVEVNYLEHWE